MIPREDSSFLWPEGAGRPGILMIPGQPCSRETMPGGTAFIHGAYMVQGMDLFVCSCAHVMFHVTEVSYPAFRKTPHSDDNPRVKGNYATPSKPLAFRGSPKFSTRGCVCVCVCTTHRGGCSCQINRAKKTLKFQTQRSKISRHPMYWYQISIQLPKS
jgi:hypothetical protein